MKLVGIARGIPLATSKRFKFSLRQPQAETDEHFPVNPVELVVEVTARIDGILNEIGIPKGRGTGERLTLFDFKTPIQREISSFLSARNKMVHSAGTHATRLSWFNRKNFIEDYCTIRKCLESIHEIINRESFQRDFILNSKETESIFQFAESIYFNEKYKQ